MPAPKYKYFKVRVIIPDGVSVVGMKEYIDDAVTHWRGSLRPPRAYGPDDDGDPLFELDTDAINVTLLPQPKRRQPKRGKPSPDDADYVAGALARAFKRRRE